MKKIRKLLRRLDVLTQMLHSITVYEDWSGHFTRSDLNKYLTTQFISFENKEEAIEILKKYIKKLEYESN